MKGYEVKARFSINDKVISLEAYLVKFGKRRHGSKWWGGHRRKH